MVNFTKHLRRIVATKGLACSFIRFHKDVKPFVVCDASQSIAILHGENSNPSQPCEGVRGGRKTHRKFTMSLTLRRVNDAF